MVSLAIQVTTKSKPLTIFQRIAGKDKTAVADCVAAYGNFIWALAQKFTASHEAAETAAEEIFLDIWRSAERADQPTNNEKLLITLIARRRLLGCLDSNAKKESVVNTDRKSEQGQERAEFSNHLRNSARYKHPQESDVNPAGNLKVLYAEDDEDSRFMIETMCKLADIEVTAAPTVAEAWRLAQIDSFDLYLLDSRFPDGSGLDLCRRLRRHAPHTPILFYSGNAFAADKRNGLEAGADEYLTKPFLADLTVVIRQNIERNENRYSMRNHFSNNFENNVA